MSPIDRIKKEYYFAVILHIFVISFSVFGLIWSITTNFDIWNKNIIELIMAFFIPLLCIIGITIFGFSLLDIVKDFKQIRSNNYKQLVGRVVGFAKNQTETGDQINNFPKIYIRETKKTIELHVNDHVNLNQEYTFLYLEHTRIGAVKCEEVEDK